MASSIDASRSTFTNHDGTQFLANSFSADTINIAATGAKDDEEHLLANLPYVPEATFNHFTQQKHSLCLPNTRTQVLHDIMAWARGEAGRGERIYWLNGMAGTGKSTIARTIARICFDDERLGASFFFSRGGGEHETARKFVTSIAAQLARRLPPLKKHICAALRSEPDVVHHILSDQWKQLVLRPFEQLGASDRLLSPLVIVVDALDECRDESEIEFVLQLLSTTSGLMTTELLIFLTSRPEIPIRQGFQGIPESRRRHLILHHIEPSVVDRDIRLFFESLLERSIQSLQLPPKISSDTVVDELVQRAGGLFIWAATACLFIQKGKKLAKNRVMALLERKESGVKTDPEQRLDEIYADVLQSTVRGDDYSEEEKEALCSVLRTVIGAIAVLFSSLSAFSLESLLYLEEDTVQNTLCDLHSILDVPDDRYRPVRPQHASVRDYVLSSKRCADPRFWVDERQAHMHVARQCLQLMDDNLHKDMLDLRSPETLSRDVSRAEVEQRYPSHLRYACLYWVQHIERSKNAVEFKESVGGFLERHFLHWLESLSWLGKLSDGIEMMALLEALYQDKEPSLRTLATDMARFMHCYRQMIAEAPLQAYLSAVVFAPARSRVRQLFSKHLPPWLSTPPHVPEDWSQELQVLEGHSSLVQGVAFSPDGQLLASASADSTVRLWNAKTGAACGIFEGHSDWVFAVAFSPDGQILASAWDTTVRLWNAKSEAACCLLNGHSKYARAVAFSPDGQLLASASDDQTVRLWYPKTGAACGIFEGHSGCVVATAFSPDGHFLASASRDGTVRLWNCKTATACGILEGHSDSVLAVAFSPDGQILASASDDRTVRLWNPKTCLACCTFQGHSKSVTSVAFSPDGRLLATASGDKTVRLWNAKTGAACGIFEGHSDRVRAVAFSPDGQILASASEDQTVRLWNATAGAAYCSREGHSGFVNAVGFSPDGQLLASASTDKTVRLWNMKSWAACGVLEGHSHRVLAVAFSPDGQILASASGDRTVRLWNAKTRAACGILEGHTDWIRAVAFSPDGQLLASASDDETVRLWYLKTGAACGILEGHTDSVQAVAFSPDGQLLASASDDETVRLWYPKTGAACGILEGHTDWVQAVAFSPDGQLLASASNDMTVRLWSPVSGELVHVLDVAEAVFQLSFSHDSRFVRTEFEAIPIGPHTNAASGTRSCSVPRYALHDQWLTYNQRGLLWLPHDYRTKNMAFYGDIVALGLHDGRVIFMSFNFESERPWQ